jgi:hypothetical protein
MTLSRQFRALWKFAVMWAIPWTLVGVLVAALSFSAYARALTLVFALPLSIYVAAHALAYGAVGLFSGLCTGLVLAYREERKASDIPSIGRAAAWGVLGGFLPFALVAAVVWFIEPLAPNLLLTLGFGAVNAGASGIIAASAVGAAHHGRLSPPSDQERIGAT